MSKMRHSWGCSCDECKKNAKATAKLKDYAPGGIHEKRERCAVRMGYEVKPYDCSTYYNDCEPEYKKAYFDSEGEFVCLVSSYHPDLSDAASLKQADDLWETLRAQGIPVYFAPCSNGHEVMCKIPGVGDRNAIRTTGEKWNQALVDAVAEMEVNDA